MEEIVALQMGRSKCFIKSGSVGLILDFFPENKVLMSSAVNYFSRSLASYCPLTLHESMEWLAFLRGSHVLSFPPFFPPLPLFSSFVVILFYNLALNFLFYC